jgi:hypothetical protein
MKKEQIAILLGYFANQQVLIERLLAEIAATELETKENVSHLGYMLHNLYGAMEDLFQEVARTFENRVEDPQRYHRELLKRMALEIPGVRPALLSSPSHSLLNELRGFRHVFRHAYDYELSPVRLFALKSRVLAEWNGVTGDLQIFQAFLQNKMGRHR